MAGDGRRRTGRSGVHNGDKQTFLHEDWLRQPSHPKATFAKTSALNASCSTADLLMGWTKDVGARDIRDARTINKGSAVSER
jgi:hypothetical protein